MRRRSSPWITRTLTALVVVAAGGCPGAAAELRITLRPGAGASLDGLSALRFVVRDLGTDTPAVYGPISLDGNRRYRLSADVTPGVDFYVDVIGCADADACEGDGFIARGCTPVLNIETDTAVDIALFDREQPEAAACPPHQR